MVKIRNITNIVSGLVAAMGITLAANAATSSAEDDEDKRAGMEIILKAVDHDQIEDEQDTSDRTLRSTVFQEYLAVEVRRQTIIDKMRYLDLVNPRFNPFGLENVNQNVTFDSDNKGFNLDLLVPSLAEEERAFAQSTTSYNPVELNEIIEGTENNPGINGFIADELEPLEEELEQILANYQAIQQIRLTDDPKTKGRPILQKKINANRHFFAAYTEIHDEIEGFHELAKERKNQAILDLQSDGKTIDELLAKHNEERNQRARREYVLDVETQTGKQYIDMTVEEQFAIDVEYGTNHVPEEVDNVNALLPTSVVTQERNLRGDLEDIEKLFSGNFKGVPDAVIGMSNEDYHYQHPFDVRTVHAESIRIRDRARGNASYVFTSIGNDGRRQQYQRIDQEQAFVDMLVNNQGVLFLDDDEVREYHSEINGAIANERITFAGEFGGKFGYALANPLAHVDDEDVKNRAMAEGLVQIPAFEAMAEAVEQEAKELFGLEEVQPQVTKTEVSDTVTVIEVPVFISKEESPVVYHSDSNRSLDLGTVTVYESGDTLTEQQILSLIQRFKGRVYGHNKIQGQDLELNTYNAFAAIGVLHGVEAMGRDENWEIRYNLLNHGNNPNVLGGSYGTQGANGPTNIKVLKELLAGNLDINLSDGQIYSTMKKLVEKEDDLKPEEWMAMDFLLSEIKTRGLEDKLMESIASEEDSSNGDLDSISSVYGTGLGNDNYLSSDLGLELFVGFDGNVSLKSSIDEELSTIAANYELNNGRGSRDKVTEAINHMRDNNVVVGRFNKYALERAGQLDQAYEILADQSMTVQDKQQAMEDELNMSISAGYAKNQQPKAAAILASREVQEPMRLVS